MRNSSSPGRPQPPRGAALRATALIAALACALAFGAGACKKSSKSKGAAKAGKKVAVPKQVLATVALRSPSDIVGGALGLVNNFVQLPFSKQMLLGLVLSRARMHRDLIEVIDIKRTLWLIAFDQRQLKDERNAALLVVPISSRIAFERALNKRMAVKSKDGDLVTYKPRPGVLGAPPARLVVRDKYVIAVSSAKVWRIAGAFAEANLVPRKPKHDVVVDVAMKNFAGTDRKKLQADIDKAIARMSRRMKTRGNSKVVVRSAQKGIRRYAEMLLSTQHVQLAADVNKDGVALTLRATAGKSGKWAEIVKRQRPGQPFGFKLLPKSSFFVASDRSNPGAKKEARGLVQQALSGALSRAPKLQATLGALYRMVMAAVPGDITVAAHAPQSGSGMAASIVARVTDAKKVHGAMTKAAKGFGDWVRALMAKRRAARKAAAASGSGSGKGTGAGSAGANKSAGGSNSPGDGAHDIKDVKVTKVPFDKDGLKGMVYKIVVPQSAADQKRMARMLGPELVLGWAVGGKHLVGVIGKDAEAHLAAMAAGAKKGAIDSSLADNKAYAAAAARPGRVGILYFSLVDLVRLLQKSGVKSLDAFAKDLAQVTVQSAPVIDWGVDSARQGFDITLRLPARHFVHFKPFLQALLRRRRLPSLGGGSVPPIPPAKKKGP